MGKKRARNNKNKVNILEGYVIETFVFDLAIYILFQYIK